jgi:DNA polymerase-1
VRDYLVKDYNAEIIDGYEADDALGVFAGPDSIIATVDKDLQQIAGFHLNFYKSRDQWQIKEVTKEEGDRFFWYQCLLGDSQDDIVGVPGLGPKKIEKLFDGKSNDELKDIVMNEYIRYYESEGFNRFDETARLIFIKRESLEMEYYNYYK